MDNLNSCTKSFIYQTKTRLRLFRFSYPSPQHSYILENVGMLKSLKFFKKVVENFAVRGKVVGNRPALVFFIDKPGLGKAPSVLRDCFEIATQTIGDFFNRNARVLGDQRQNFNPPVVCHAF